MTGATLGSPNPVAPKFGESREDFNLPAVVMSTAMHLLLAGVLVFGIQWQSKAPDTMMVELWNTPTPEPPPEVRPEMKPEPRPAPKAEPPRVEARPPVKPDIAVQQEKKPAPKKPEPREEPKLDLKQDFKAQLDREMAQVAKSRPEAPVKSAPPAAAAPSLDAAYANRIRGRIRGNIVLPGDISGNPEAIFDVTQIPDGTVITVKLRKSSGHRAYDEAVERAILKSSPLPRPDRPDQFQRALELRFRPVD